MYDIQKMVKSNKNALPLADSADSLPLAGAALTLAGGIQIN